VSRCNALERTYSITSSASARKGGALAVLRIDDQLECGRLFDWQICGFRALEDPVDDARRIGGQSTSVDILAHGEERRQFVPDADMSNFTSIPDDHTVACVVDGRLGSQCLQQLVLLFDTRLLVVDMQRRHDAVEPSLG